MTAASGLETTAFAPAVAGRITSLPADVLGQSCRRIGIVSSVFAGLWAFTLLMNNVVLPLAGFQQPLGQAGSWPMPGNVIAVVGIAISVGMVFVARTFHHRPNFLLDLGLGFEVATALLIGLLNQWRPVLEPGQLSWICVIILVYPALVPNTPRKTILAALAAASMDPLGLGITALRDPTVHATLAETVLAFLPNYLCAIMAAIPAHIIVGLGRHVKKARELGNYQLGEIVGQGGMGEVHRATHRMLKRPAAIKLVRPEVLAHSPGGGDVVLERFRREARAAAMLRSPHTIELYDFGVSEEGTFYYVMELLDGLDLQTLIDRFGPVPAERAVHFLRQACSSLGEAHSLGLIHRDIKPANLYASRLGLTVDFIKVLDFGLVKNVGPEPDSALTAPQVTTGTPAFMAPEVAQGDEVDQRADVYSLGCVTYWLLTGQLVFTAQNPIKMMHQHIQDTPEPPSTRTELPVSKALDDLVLACLAKQPDDRPSNGEELGLLCSTVDLPEHWTDERARRWWHTNCPTCLAEEPCEQSVLAPALSLD